MKRIKEEVKLEEISQAELPESIKKINGKAVKRLNECILRFKEAVDGEDKDPGKKGKKKK